MLSSPPTPQLALLDESAPLRSSPKPYVASLDGLRGIAVLAVIAHHFGLPGGEIGWLGVDMFFVLSGFLITTLLCRECDLTGTINFPKFWLRRACRLLPIYALYASFIIAIVCTSGVHHWTTQGHWTPALFIASICAYFVNLAPGGLFPQQRFTWHLWSLAIEEQFYFCWPFLCLVLLRQRRPYVLPVIFVVGMMGFFAIPLKHASTFHDSYIRTEGIVVGCAVALLVQFRQVELVWTTLRNSRIRIASAFACVVLILVGYLATVSHTGRAMPHLREILWAWLVPVFVLCFAYLVAALWYGPADRFAKLLAVKPLAYVGRISYGIYLYHLACIPLAGMLTTQFANRLHLAPRFALVTVIYLATVLIVASLSYRLIEQPFLALKDRFTADGGHPLAPPVRRKKISHFPPEFSLPENRAV